METKRKMVKVCFKIGVLTVEGFKSGGLSDCLLTTRTNAGAGNNPDSDRNPNYVCNPPLFIVFFSDCFS